jgi:cystathionine beta-lyase
VPVSDVTAGIRLVLDVLSERAPVVLPTPAYPPQLMVSGVTGRELVTLPLDPDAADAALDLAAIDRALAAGARTVLLTQPHNPLGRVYRRVELEGLRDVVTTHGARVVSDEIHAPLVLPGVEHVPYLSLPGTADHAVSVVAASKAFNTAGLRCAQVVTADEATRDRLVGVPEVRNDSWSPLGVVAAVAAYTEGDAWLAALVDRLDGLRTLLVDLLATHLPAARMRPVEATYLAWLDLRAYGHHDPAAVIRQRGKVVLSSGQEYEPGSTGHARLNFATSAERLSEIVCRSAEALGRR